MKKYNGGVSVLPPRSLCRDSCHNNEAGPSERGDGEVAGACLAGCMQRLRPPRPHSTLPLEIPRDRVALRNRSKPSVVQGPPCPRLTWCQRLDANRTHLSHNYEGRSSATFNKLPRETEPMWIRRGGNELLVVGQTIQNHSP